MRPSSLFFAALPLLGTANAQVLSFFALTYSGPSCTGSAGGWYSEGACLNQPIKAGGSISATSLKALVGYSGPKCTGSVIYKIDHKPSCDKVTVDVASWGNPYPEHI